MNHGTKICFRLTKKKGEGGYVLDGGVGEERGVRDGKYISGKHVHEKYTPLNPTFIQKNWGLQGYTYF